MSGDPEVAVTAALMSGPMKFRDLLSEVPELSTLDVRAALRRLTVRGTVYVSTDGRFGLAAGYCSTCCGPCRDES